VVIMPSTDVQIRTVDPNDDHAFRAWFDAMIVGGAAGRVDPPLPTYAESVAHHRHASPTHRNLPFVASRDGVAVGAGNVVLPLRDNLRAMSFFLAVLPEQRCQGVGSALYDVVAQQAHKHGRSILVTELMIPGDIDPGSWPGAGFLTRRGYTLRNTELRRELPLPVTVQRLDELADKAAERAGAYRLASWTGPCPDEYAADYAQIKGLLASEAPTGDLDIEPQVWDVARLRDDEQAAAAKGRTLYTTVALAPDGRIAGHTQLVVSQHTPERASQSDTLVRREHRGHRLGLAVKVANLRMLQAKRPEVCRVSTFNAVQNGPMVRVNEELGFVVLETLQEWQRDL
jgi:GNAT superfamily N-acetyltransferase